MLMSWPKNLPSDEQDIDPQNDVSQHQNRSFYIIIKVLQREARSGMIANSSKILCFAVESAALA
ncbi:hypothetical protein C5748_04995 [Phyllobacterium phragmitis]|uniref:Uncharacterized protein n=1 Tax=Phyllobacterium phragmitis TaxID=2670329 RepID=A0A2S9IW49_9HYPH|nr:hypothetical protein C5748_04995 [Phyllobacterium phragmitis]